jgi:tetratricopeptide (TPR) repeat protein/tRNA A-37 threonylcarbamoyl transferase component Bud32
MNKQTLRCAAGHEWEWDGVHPHSADTVTCPQCGKAANTLILPAKPATPAQASDGPADGMETMPSDQPLHSESTVPASAGWPIIAGYEIVAELGRGGMGVVYKATQTSLRRIVAIKLFLTGSLDRFRLEAEAIARLQHPHIVQVFEVGTSFRGPYFSQEFIAGGSLADRLDGAPWPAAKAAALVATLAEAVQFTHDRNIIHRDLKPANILMADDQTPKISDFGLAKESDRDSGQTATGDIMGSPSYMAPEQAGGVTKHITPATDIYALGAILYELLTGRPPFYGETAMDTVFQVLSNEPIAPRQLQPKLPRDIETICLKCLEKLPRDRYATAQELADDLRRFGLGEPIRALPVPTWMRAVKWARRRPGLAAAISTATLATLFLIVGGIVYNILLVGALRTADDERQRRDATLVQAQDVVDQLLSGFSEQRLAHLPHSESLRHDLLTSSLALCEKLQAENPEKPELRWQVGRAQRQSADLQSLLGKTNEAAASYARSIATLDALVAEKSSPKYARELAGAHNNLAALLVQTGRPADAEAEYRLAIDGFEKLAAAQSSDTEIARQLARAWDGLGVALLTDSRPQDAAHAIETSQAMLNTLGSQPGDEFALRKSKATNFNSLGMLYQQMAEPAKAVQALLASQQLYQELVTAAPDDPEYRFGLASSSANLAFVRAVGHAGGDEDKQFQAASQLFEQLTADYPGVELYRAQWAHALANYGAVFQSRGENGAAASVLQQAQRLYEKLVAGNGAATDYRARLADCLQREGTIAIKAEELDKADDLLSRSIDMQTVLVKANPARADYHAVLAAANDGAGDLMLARKDPAKARYYFERAIEEQQEAVRVARAPDEFKAPLRGQYASLAAAFLEIGEPDHAAAAAEQLAGLAPDDGATLVQAAGLLARCIPIIDRVKANVPATLADDCGRRAVELLRAAAEKGETLPADLNTAAEYEPLRDRADFKTVTEAQNKRPH